MLHDEQAKSSPISTTLAQGKEKKVISRTIDTPSAVTNKLKKGSLSSSIGGKNDDLKQLKATPGKDLGTKSKESKEPAHYSEEKLSFENQDGTDVVEPQKEELTQTGLQREKRESVSGFTESKEKVMTNLGCMFGI